MNTELLLRAAELLHRGPHRYDIIEFDACATELLALADQMERAEPVGTVRTCVWNGQGWTVSLIVPTKMRVGDPLYASPAPEVTRDAAVARIQAWAQLPEPPTSEWSEGYEDARGWVRMQLEATLADDPRQQAQDDGGST